MTSTDTGGTAQTTPFPALERHVAGLHALAQLLTAEPDLAEHLVVRAVRTSLLGDDLRRLAAAVVRAWLDQRPDGRDRIPSAIPAIPVVPAVPAILAAVHALPPRQRASLALCRFGGHTYRDAAALMDVPPAEVADLLTSSLRALLLAPPAPEADPVRRRAV
jgi:DNA-directed RNA polymerase specialized sigma24 family protein